MIVIDADLWAAGFVSVNFGFSWCVLGKQDSGKENYCVSK
jgi:hypothetical protein